MKKGLILLALLIILIVAASFIYKELSVEYVAPVASPEPTDEAKVKALDISILDYQENSVKLSDYFGKPIVLNFWATWCGPCRSEFPAFEKAYSEYGEEIQFLMINLTDGKQDTIEGVRSFVDENGYSFPVYFDTSLEAALTYGVYSIPLSVFIDSDGNVIALHNSAMDQDTLYAYLDVIK